MIENKDKERITNHILSFMNENSTLSEQIYELSQ
jgi:hypothetical protein